jgi:hypothetical protein
MDVTLDADIVGGASARVVSDEHETTTTNETVPLDDESAMASGELPDADPLEIAIRLQAYELYRSRGEMDGDDLADWLEAERIVRRLMS